MSVAVRRRGGGHAGGSDPVGGPGVSAATPPVAARAAPAQGGRVAAGAGTPFTVFLDRDGVFNVNPPRAVFRWQDFKWLPGAKEAFARLARPGIRTCLVTNQPTVGLGLLPLWRLGRIHAVMRRELEDAGGGLDRIEAAYAPFRHRRRKPNPGMFEDAARAFAASGVPVDKRRAVMVGDKAHKDAAAAAAFGIPCILLTTTYDAVDLRAVADKAGIPVHAVVPDLAAAVDLILAMADGE